MGCHEDTGAWVFRIIEGWGSSPVESKKGLFILFFLDFLKVVAERLDPLDDSPLRQLPQLKGSRCIRKNRHNFLFNFALGIWNTHYIGSGRDSVSVLSVSGRL